MRPLSEPELTAVLTKLKTFMNENIATFLQDGKVLRLHKDRVFYLSESLLAKAQHIPRKNLVLAGVLLGKFTHSKKFRLLATALSVLADQAKNRVWLKTGNPLQSFLYGNHIVKAHVKKMTEGIGKNDGVVIMTDEGGSDVAVGFGVISKDGIEVKGMGVESIVVYHQSDCGEYLRDEASLV
jgi:60S ribosome subunit biogenesis protein NIP7